MSTFTLTALPSLAIGLFFIALFLRKKDKNFLIPGAVMIVAGLVNLAIGLSIR